MNAENLKLPKSPKSPKKGGEGNNGADGYTLVRRLRIHYDVVVFECAIL